MFETTKEEDDVAAAGLPTANTGSARKASVTTLRFIKLTEETEDGMEG